MFSGGRLCWLTSDQGLLALLAQNRLRDTFLVAAIVFCETGLGLKPFLTGNWSLFVTGALLGLSTVAPLEPILIAAAVIHGDTLNVSIARSPLSGQMTCTKNCMSWFLLAIVVVTLPPALVQVKRGRAASNP